MSKVLIFDLDYTITNHCTKYDKYYAKILVNILNFANEQNYKMYIVTARFPNLGEISEQTYKHNVDDYIYNAISKNIEEKEEDVNNVPYRKEFLNDNSNIKLLLEDKVKYMYIPYKNRFYCRSQYWIFASESYIMEKLSNYKNNKVYIKKVRDFIKNNNTSIVKMYQIMLIMKNNPRVNPCEVYFFDDSPDHLVAYNFWIQNIYPEMKFINIIGAKENKDVGMYSKNIKQICALDIYPTEYLKGLGLIATDLTNEYGKLRQKDTTTA